MTALLVFSPHLDDAVLSMGRVIGGAPGAVVVTVFAGVPTDGAQLRPFDERSGWSSADQAIRNRREEDREALKILGARPVHLNHTDGQYDEPRDRDAILRSMRRAVAETKPRIVAGPLGVAHPDHRDVGTVYYELVEGLSPEIQAWVYEDLPGRVLEPGDAGLRLSWWFSDLALGDLVLGVPFEPCEVETKVVAVRRYRSQMWALDPVWHPCMCPERLWQVHR